MKTIYLFIPLILANVFAWSQKINGAVQDPLGYPVAGATVVLYHLKDSSIAKINITDSIGRYSFSVTSPGNYYATISNTGYRQQRLASVTVSGNDVVVSPVQLEKEISRMKEVVVTSKKPMIEVRADKTVFNVEGSINAVGSDVMELLRKAPGVVIDKDDNIIMSGKNGVAIYIDGRPTPLTGDALASYLRSIPSASIEAIELITNPSAKYEAAGNAGIINIKLKKNSSFGSNGSVNMGYAVGVYPKSTAGFSFNNRNKSTNIFGNYTYNNALNQNMLFVTRSQSDTGFSQHSTATNRNRSHNYKAGIDYFINTHNTLGLIVNGNIENKNSTLYSETPIIYTPTQTTVRWLVADNTNDVDNNNVNINFNYRHSGKGGKELSMDADYGNYYLNSVQMQPNYYYNATRSFEEKRNVYEMDAPSHIKIYSYRTDFEQDQWKGKLSMGAKFSYVKSANDFVQYNILNSLSVYDSARSNSFAYKENINALYVNYNRQYPDILVQVGLRMENSNIEGISSGFAAQNSKWVPTDSAFTENYTDIFPSAAITFNKQKNNQFGLSYSRRIDRPAYQDMNPFEVKIDEYSYYKGNTELMPQYTNSFSLTHSYKGKLNTRINYSSVKDVFTRLIDTTERVKSYLIKKNVATQQVFSININYGLQCQWYSIFANINAFHSKYAADFGKGRKIDLSVNSVTLNIQQSARLGKGFLFEMSGFYNSPSIWNGTFSSKEMYGLDAGLQKKIFSDRVNIRISFSDIFHTQRWYGTSDFVGQHLEAIYRWEAQQFKANLTWNFGKSSIKAIKQRKTATDEEGKRVQLNGGSLTN